MSANINMVKGKASFVTVKEPAWHRLGTIVQNAMTSSEAIRLAGLDYEVKKANIMAEFDEADIQRHDVNAGYVEDKYATYRADTLDTFGVVGSKYEIVQNRDAFTFIDSIIGEERAIFETAGALGKGETTFITCKLPYFIKVNGHDTIENYLVVSNGHDGRSSLNIFLTPIRVVCQNTLALGKDVAKFNIALRHTASIHDKLEDASKILNISRSITEETQEMYRHLAKVKVTDEVAENYFNSLMLSPDEHTMLARTGLKFGAIESISTRKKNVLTDLNKYYREGIGQSDIIGTAYGVYNAYNGYLSNVKKYGNNSKKMQSLNLGGADFKNNNKALDMALSLDV